MGKDLTPQQQRTELIKAQIVGSFNNADDLIEKGGAKMPIGTISNGYKKVAEGKWQKVSKHGMTHAEHREKMNQHNQMGAGKALNKKMENDKLRHMKEASKHKIAKEDLDEKDYSDEEVLGKKSSHYASEEDEKSSKEWLEDYFNETSAGNDFDISQAKFSLDAFSKHFHIDKDLAKTIIYNLEDEDTMRSIAAGDYDKVGFGESDFNDAYWDIVYDNPEFAQFMGEEVEEDEEDYDDED